MNFIEQIRHSSRLIQETTGFYPNIAKLSTLQHRALEEAGAVPELDFLPCLGTFVWHWCTVDVGTASECKVYTPLEVLGQEPS